MNPAAGGESRALLNITVYIFTHFDSLVNFPILPALSSQTYVEHALHSFTGSVAFWGQNPAFQFARMYVGKTYSNHHSLKPSGFQSLTEKATKSTEDSNENKWSRLVHRHNHACSKVLPVE